MDNKLFYGKSGVQRIVSLEPGNETCELFIQKPDGRIFSEEVPNRYWILTATDPGGWKRLQGNQHYCFGKQYDNQKKWWSAKQNLKKAGFDVYTISDPKENFMVLKGYTYFQGLQLKDISVLSFDIESTTLDPKKPEAKVLLISNTFRASKGIVTKKLFAFDEYENEGEMIKDWCSFVRQSDPTVITGHNINGFDIPYLKTIGKKYGVNLKLGRNGSNLWTNSYESKFRKDGSQDLHYFKNYIYGRELIDSLFLSYKYDIQRVFPSYGLKPIISYLESNGLLNANKERTFYPAEKIRENYKNPEEWKKIKEYCRDDADDSLKLFDLMAPAQFYLTQSIPKSFQGITESATGSQLNSFLVRSYLQEGFSIPKASQLEKVKGGISFGIPGIYKNVLKIDLKSAYPSQVLRFKLYDSEKDPHMNFYKMVHYFTYERFALKDKFKETKDQYYSDREQAGKIVINSAYGLMNTPGLNFNNSNIANKITKETREMIELSLKWASDKGMEYYKSFMKEESEESA